MPRSSPPSNSLYCAKCCVVRPNDPVLAHTIHNGTAVCIAHFEATIRRPVRRPEVILDETPIIGYDG